MTTLPELHNFWPRLFQFFLIILAVTAVADIFLKKAAANGGWVLILTSPWLYGAILLYIFQIIFFTYLFRAGKELSLVGSLQTILYALIVLGAGIFLFQESLTRLQIIGILLALSGVILINLK